MKTQILFVITFFLQVSLFAQVAGERMSIDILRIDGSEYADPDVGGMNNPQFSEIDFNNDGFMDLFVFDKTGNVVMTYLNDGIIGEVSYTFAPEYAKVFPRSIKEWALLRDYNQDGIMDVFCYSSTQGIAGIDLYKGSYDDNGELQFDLIINYHNDFNLLSFPGFSGLELEIYVSRDDLPSIVDVDEDGDLDVLTFSQAGNKMEWYRNLSQEMGYGNDSLYFDFIDPCWGLFIESGTSSSIETSTSPNQCADLNLRLKSGGAHVGSTSVCWDNDGDGDLELIVGDVTTNTLSYLNSSTVDDDETPWYDILDSSFPSYDTSVDLPLFPAPFILDLDNDGRKDFLACPNDLGSSRNRKVVWRYDNFTDSGEGQFNFREDDFLVGDCIDLGQGSKPVFFDYNADGLMDIVVGTDGAFANLAVFDTRLVLFENIGTTDTPSYQLVDEDWLSFSQYADRNLAPAFGDLDGDGDLDLLVGQNDGELFYAENTGGSGIPSFPLIAANFQGIVAGQKCVPAMADMDGDGLTDILSGVKQGRIDFFKNTGTAGNPSFNPDITAAPNVQGLGGMDVRFEENGFTDTRGYASPKVIYADGSTPLVVSGSYFNSIFIYDNIGTDVTLDYTEVIEGYGEILQGQETAMDLADIDADGYYEIVVGNRRGGIAFYNTDIVSDSTVPNEEVLEEELSFSVFPNPVEDVLEIKMNGMLDEDDLEIALVDMSGKQIIPFSNRRILDTSPLAAGVYMVVIKYAGNLQVEKVVKL